MTESMAHVKVGLLPSDWDAFKLSDVIDLIHGYQFRSDDFTEEGLAVIKISNVIGSGLYTDDLTFIDSNRYDEFSKYEILEGDILMSLTGNIGRVVEVGALDRKYVQNYRVGKFVPVSASQLNKKYIKYLLSSPVVLSQFFKFSNQSAQANFGKQDMDKVWIAIPSQPLEQQKIAEILSTVDEKIDTIDQKIKETEALKKGMMQRLLTKGIGHTQFKDSPLGEIPESWEIKELNQVTDYVDYRGKTPPKVEEGILLVTAKNIKMGFIDYSVSQEFIPEDLYNEVMSRGVPKIGDVLITTEAPLGNVASVNIENIALAQRVIKYRGMQGVIDNKYLKFYMLSPLFQSLLAKESTGSTVKGIKGSRLHKLNVLIPTLEEQKKISQILELVFNKIDVLTQSKTHFTSLKKGLMQKLLTGKIRVNSLIKNEVTA
jgi:type I restriction enzyme S subunit